MLFLCSLLHHWYLLVTVLLEFLKQNKSLTFGTNSLMSYITSAFSDKKYWKVMVISAVGYGVFFGFLSQIFIYRGDISFTGIGIAVPSINVITC